MELEIKDLDKFKENVKFKIADEIFSKSQRNLNTREAFSYKGAEKPAGQQITDTGSLLQSGEPPTPNNTVLRYTAPHSKYIEYGTMPHKPPLKPLHDWSKRKLDLSGDHAWAVAKVIQKNIEKHGTEPKPFLRNAMDEVKSKYEE